MLHHLRYTCAAVVVGLLWFGVVVLFAASLPIPWTEARADPSLAVLMVVATLLPALVFRRRLGRVRLRTTLPVTLVALLIGSLAYGAVMFAWAHLFLGGVEEIQEARGPVAKAWWATLCILVTFGWNIGTVLTTAYASVPLAWVSILILRWSAREGVTGTQALTDSARVVDEAHHLP